MIATLSIDDSPKINWEDDDEPPEFTNDCEDSKPPEFTNDYEDSNSLQFCEYSSLDRKNNNIVPNPSMFL